MKPVLLLLICLAGIMHASGSSSYIAKANAILKPDLCLFEIDGMTSLIKEDTIQSYKSPVKKFECLLGLSVTPTLNFSRDGMFNLGVGPVFSIRIGDFLSIAGGGRMHLFEYRVKEDKFFSPNNDAVFLYMQRFIGLSFVVLKRKNYCAQTYLGVSYGSGYFKQGTRASKSIDLLNHNNFALDFGCAVERKIGYGWAVKIQPIVMLFVYKIRSTNVEFGPSPFPYETKIDGTDAQAALYLQFSLVKSVLAKH